MLLRHLIDDPKPIRRARQLLYLARHRAEHRAFGEAMAAAHADGLIGEDALSPYKYLGAYLAAFLTTAARRRIILFHYDFLASVLRGEMRARWGRPLLLWRREDAPSGRTLAITLDAPDGSWMEGERQLRLQMGGDTLFTLTFAFVPGDTMDMADEVAMFVGGLQGKLDRRREIRIAAKANGEIAPAAMLVLAARALGAALGVPTLIGISTEQQAAMGYARHRISLDYDAIWEGAGAVQSPRGYFTAPMRGEERDDEPVLGKHRSRTRRRRMLRTALFAEIELRARILLGRFGEQSSLPKPPMRRSLAA